MNGIPIYYFSENEKNKYYILTIGFTDHAKAFDCVDYNTLWTILWDENTRPPYLPS